MFTTPDMMKHANSEKVYSLSLCHLTNRLVQIHVFSAPKLEDITPDGKGKLGLVHWQHLVRQRRVAIHNNKENSLLPQHQTETCDRDYKDDVTLIPCSNCEPQRLN